MVVHWCRERGARWRARTALNGTGALLAGVSAVVVTATRFQDGARLVVIALPLLVLAFEAVRRAYARTGERMASDGSPAAPRQGCVKGVRAAVWKPSTVAGNGRGGVFLDLSVPCPNLLGVAMADVAFVVTTIAVFALVALVAKGVTKL